MVKTTPRLTLGRLFVLAAVKLCSRLSLSQYKQPPISRPAITNDSVKSFKTNLKVTTNGLSLDWKIFCLYNNRLRAKIAKQREIVPRRASNPV